MKWNFIKANYQVIEILKQKNVREDALKKQVESKLSRIRKRCYIALDAENAADFAKVYSKEVEKYLRRFKIAGREHSKWKNKMKQTTNAVLKITMDSVNEKECHEDTGVAVLKRKDETETSNDNKEKNLPQEILDIPDSCEEKAVREDFAEKNVVGFDIVELCPNSSSKPSEFLAAKLYYKMLSYKFMEVLASDPYDNTFDVEHAKKNNLTKFQDSDE